MSELMCFEMKGFPHAFNIKKVLQLALLSLCLIHSLGGIFFFPSKLYMILLFFYEELSNT